MSERRPNDELERRLQAAAAHFAYPPTPTITASVRQRLTAEHAPRRRPVLPWRPIAIAVAIALLVLLAVPGVRAGIRELLRIGSLTIFQPQPTAVATPAPPPTALPATATETAGAATSGPTATLRPTLTSLDPPLDLSNQMSLEDARQEVPFRLPTYPPGIGPPDAVFVQNFGGPVAVMVWLKPGTRDQARFSLHALTGPALAEKFLRDQTQLEQTTVNGRDAAWVRGLHLLSFVYDRRSRQDREVRGNVLIWTQDKLTYRLEVPDDMPLDEARKIAESLR